MSIGWINPFGQDCIQLNVQRSYDSTKGFRTIFSAVSPELPQNGFIDAKANGSKLYYRIFFMLNTNMYYFTKSKSSLSGGFVSATVTESIDEEKTVNVILRNNRYKKFSYPDFKKFSDSILANTKDSLVSAGDNTVILKPYTPSGTWMASSFIFTDRTGNVSIRLPNAKEKKYSIIIYDTDNTTPLYNIKHVTDGDLILDKSNFIHAGWFTFELFEEDKLKERNKFYLQKDF